LTASHAADSDSAGFKIPNADGNGADGNGPAIVFDLGGVLLDWNPRHLYRRLFPGDPEAMETFLATVCTMEWNAQMDRGYPFNRAVAELVQRFPEQASLIRAYDERWEEMIAGLIPETVSLAKRLQRAGYPLYALSDWSVEKFEIIRRKYAFFDTFRDIVLSGEVGIKKPDLAVFRAFLQRTGRAARDCLFIDDTPVNLQAAARLDFRTLHFQSAAQLRQDLTDLGLLKEH
jgi:2-haloacid dehalogenase